MTAGEGEGWLLPAEMVAMLKCGVGNIVCLEPFGCLANHISGKGVEKKLKSLYNRLNLLFLDMDPGISEVNILNRLHFIVMSAREVMQTERLVGEDKLWLKKSASLWAAAPPGDGLTSA
jgi:predicted nucleotide-binding protein (sugar kinase/HSP70/actin superfamily)